VNEFTIQLQKDAMLPVGLDIYDINGKLLYRDKMYQRGKTYLVGDMFREEGIYIIRVDYQNGLFDTAKIKVGK
jgi:hypothetical protein